ncbi:MAG: glycosyltransferase family 2 protein [Elusimicrobiota bacterium]
MSIPELSVVLPCYNEAGNIEGLLERYRSVARKVALELVCVDNGSTDDTPAILARELAKPENGFARGVRVENNMGYGHGIQIGLESARAPVTAYSHADLQCPPGDVLTALELFRRHSEEGPCLIKGRRKGKRAFLDQCVTWVYNGLAAFVLGLRAVPADRPAVAVRDVDINAEPKLFDRTLITDLGCGPKDFTYDLFTLYRAKRRGMRIIEFEVSYEARKWGKSKLAANPWIRLKTSVNAFAKIFMMRAGRYGPPKGEHA